MSTPKRRSWMSRGSTPSVEKQIIDRIGRAYITRAGNLKIDQGPQPTKPERFDRDLPGENKLTALSEISKVRSDVLGTLPAYQQEALQLSEWPSSFSSAQIAAKLGIAKREVEKIFLSVEKKVEIEQILFLEAHGLTVGQISRHLSIRPSSIQKILKEFAHQKGKTRTAP
jgi:hypothetical protein